MMTQIRRRAADRIPRPWRLIAIAAVSVLLWGGAAITGAAVLSQRANQTCESVHTLYVALDQILAANDERLARAMGMGMMTPEQAVESRRFNARARVMLRGGDCK